MSGYIGFWIFAGAILLLIMLPYLFEVKPQTPEAPKASNDNANNENEAKWRRMHYAMDAQWRRMLYMMHLRRERALPPPAQPPIQINIISPDAKIALAPPGEAQAVIENNSNPNENAVGPSVGARAAGRPRLRMKKFSLSRPRLALPRPRKAANSRIDDTN